MGSGNSELYIGTKGASHDYYRPPFDEISQTLAQSFTKENQLNYMSVSGLTLSGSKKQKTKKSYVSPDDVLIMIENYAAGAVSRQNFVNWLELICTDDRFVIAFDLRVILLAAFGRLKTCETDKSFSEEISRLIEKIQPLWK